MFIQQDQYVPALAAEAGVRVLIHPKGTPPFPEDNGLSIPAAHFTSVGLRQVDASDIYLFSYLSVYLLLARTNKKKFRGVIQR